MNDKLRAGYPTNAVRRLLPMGVLFIGAVSHRDPD